MIVLNKIWEEIEQADVCVRHALVYTSGRRKVKRWIDFAIAIISGVGTFGYLFDNRVPFYFLLIIAIGSVVKAIFPKCIQPEEELCELDGLIEFYERYKIDLEKIYYELDKNIKDEYTSFKEFHKLKDMECEKKARYNKLYHGTSKEREELFKEETKKELEEVYENKFDEEITNEG